MSHRLCNHTHNLQEKRYFLELTLIKAHVSTISGTINLVEGFGRANITLPNGTRFHINDALYSSKSRRNLLNFKDSLNLILEPYLGQICSFSIGRYKSILMQCRISQNSNLRHLTFRERTIYLGSLMLNYILMQWTLELRSKKEIKHPCRIAQKHWFSFTITSMKV